MLVVGDHTTLINSAKMVVFNFSSFLEGPEKLNLLPMGVFSFSTEQEFDMAYANFLMTDNNNFYSMMKVVMALYAGFDVYLLMSNLDQKFEQINESFLKFIQQRYGYPYRVVNTLEDLEYACSSYVNDSFSIPGLHNLDVDKERFALLGIERMKADGIGFIPEGCFYYNGI